MYGNSSPHPMIDLDWIRQACGNWSLSTRECIDRQDEVGPNILFDVKFYREKYQHEMPQNMTCLEHFCRQDRNNLRDPSPLFSTKQWLETYSAHSGGAHSTIVVPPGRNGWCLELSRQLGKEALFARNEMLRSFHNEIIKKDIVVGLPPHRGQEICLFVHYDRHDTIQPYVFDYLDALHKEGLCIFFLTNSQTLAAKDIASLKKYVWRILCTDNRAYDWGLFSQAVKLLDNKFPGSPILLANDSVTYLGQGLKKILDRCRLQQDGITGAVDGWQHFWHLQSFFVYCGASVVGSRSWSGFWNHYRPHNNKWFVINSQEYGFSRWMQQQKVPMSAIWDYKSLIKKEYKKNRAEKWREDMFLQKKNLNASHDLWDILLDNDFPFIKNSILKGSLASGNLDHICNVISKLGKERI
ncbi:hypothetical protein [Komagataeibacter sp. FXV3]|uniref:hypothetical protein n=1 Tax=Komagataeibacter sp. FXV3 TaxID=2608998 RepID=UPI00187B37F8|nr:hypothetical protein [Komagataeibacter sp. FXV3]MBE7731372.1 hypothetical protein [Komagataeibacter sp. FXV3]